jgi:hypothetical protein
MVAPDVLSEIDTLSVEENVVPLAGLMLGVAVTAALCVYDAEATPLCAKPLAVANAWTVVVALRVIGPEYTDEDVVGVLPLVV